MCGCGQAGAGAALWVAHGANTPGSERVLEAPGGSWRLAVPGPALPVPQAGPSGHAGTARSTWRRS